MNSILLGQILSCLSSSHQEEHWNKNDVLTLVFSPFPYVFRILKTGSMELRKLDIYVHRDLLWKKIGEWRQYAHTGNYSDSSEGHRVRF